MTAALLCLAAAFACSDAICQRNEPLVALPQDQPFDAAKVALGARLFDDKRFAHDDSLACSGCHDLRRGGVDSRPQGRVFSPATGGARHVFNTPTVYNAGLNYRQQWTGGAQSLEDLVDKVVASPLVFHSSWPEVLRKLAADAPLAAEFRRVYPEQGLAVCVALLDIDLFKSINDRHGHAAGDEVLRRFAAVATRTLRATDLLGRWGGEEFLVALPQTALEPAARTLQKLRDALAKSDFGDVAPGLRISFSGGLVQLGAGETIAAAVERADQAMYRAKTSGRNRIESAAPAGEHCVAA